MSDLIKITGISAKGFHGVFPSERKKGQKFIVDIELSINLVKAITPQVKRLRAIGHVVHCGKQLATTEGRLVGPDGTLYAHATSTCLVFDLKHNVKT